MEDIVAIVNDCVRDKFLLYKKLILIPSAIVLSTIIRNKHDKFYVASSYVKYLYANRNTKSKLISIVVVTVHVFISNIVFFFVVFSCAAKFWQTVFSKLKINTLIPLLNLFIGAVIFSSAYLFIGYIMHAIVLKKRGLSFKDFVANGELEDELLCTGIFSLLFVICVRICTKFLRIFKKLIFSTLELDARMSLQLIKLRISVVKNVFGKIEEMLSSFNDICNGFQELSELMGNTFVMRLNLQRNAIIAQCKYYYEQFKFWEDVCDSYGKRYMDRSHIFVKCADDILQDLRGIEDQFRSIMGDLVDSLEMRKNKRCSICKNCKVLSKTEKELNEFINGVRTLLDEPMIGAVRIDVIVGCNSGSMPSFIEKCYYG
ncbi:integral membrane protein [Ehrlichia ruminantium]|nr:integral membrane protein [Ehrlichia ruminantium]